MTEEQIPYSGISSTNSEEKHSKTSRCDLSQSDFTVIWDNLTFRVDSRRWYTKAKERFFSQDSRQQNETTGDDSGINGGRLRCKEKIILNQVCGDAKSRQLTAIMGPSGAGKSSLLHCLFQNRTVGTTGRILVESRSKNKLKVCFIPQRDYLNEFLTVREDLIFVSKLKLARINALLRDDSSSFITSEQNSTSNNSYVKQIRNESCTSLIDHEANALYVSELLGLNNCLDVIIKNISGGQKKRLSIARELMSKPDILILDEPTTGLDSLNCYKTIMLLRDLAQLSPNPMAVIVTIHQPQRAVFHLFDKTYFLSNKGRVIYDGNPKYAVETIENIAKVKLPLPSYNPASFLIEIASDELQGSVIDRLSAYQRTNFFEKYDYLHLKRLMKSNSGPQNWKFCTVEDKSSLYSDNSFVMRPQTLLKEESYQSNVLNQICDGTTVEEITSPDEPDFCTDQYFISRQLSSCLSSHTNNLLQSFRHIFILTHRSWLSVIRNPSLTKSRLVFHTLLPLMMLLVFGTQMGNPNNCPKLEYELDIQDMRNNIKNGLIAKNVEETRLCGENISFFFILIYGFGINVISCTASFYPLTMHMFKKETINGLYSSGPYFIGQMLAELPLEIFFPTISILLSYPLSGQLSSFMGWRMFAIAFIVFLVNYSIHSLGLLCGAIFINDVSVSVLFGQALLLPFCLFSGFIIRTTRMPDWMYKLTYTSPFKQGLYAIMAARYGFNVCDCDEEMLPGEGGVIGISGMSPRIKHVIDYMFPKSNITNNSSESSNNFQVTEIFDQLGQRFVKAQTFALDLKTCEDVKPYVMHVFDVHDSDLFIRAGCLLVIIIVFKLITFSIMRSFPFRIS